MSLVVAGTFRAPPEALARLKPHMLAMIEASRAEPGCMAYAYAIDVFDPSLVRVFEEWRGPDDLEAHFASAHLTRWREVCGRFGVSERRLISYEVARSQPV